MNKKAYYFLYRTTNLVNGKYYKGLHSTNDLFDGYLGSGTAFLLALKKYGRKAFKRQIILFLPDETALKEAEKMYITQEDLSSDMCYNIRQGGAWQRGSVGIPKSPMTKDYRLALSKGQTEHYLRRKARGEVTYKPAIARERKEPLRDQEDSERHRGKLNPMYGKSGAFNETSKAVYCVELGRVFESAMLAAKELGVAFQNISKVCQGKRNTCGGYHWYFLDPSKDSRKKKRKDPERPSWYVPFDPSKQGPHEMTGFTNVRSKPVRCVETGVVFGSCSLAAKHLNMTPNSFSYYCTRNKACKGYHFVFLDACEA